MKLLLCLVVIGLVVAAYAETPLEKVRKHSDSCRSQSGVSDDVLARARKGENLDDPKLKENSFCALKKGGFIDTSGDFQVKTMKTKFKQNYDHPEKVDDLVAKCAVKKDTPQDSSSGFFKCLRDSHSS
jgi:hypothetical protein